MRAGRRGSDRADPVALRPLGKEEEGRAHRACRRAGGVVASFRVVLIVAAAALTVLVGPGRAHAVPAPMPDAEMLKQSDLVVEAEAIDIACEGPAIRDPDRVMSRYLSTLRPLRTVKGTPPEPLKF